MRLLKRLGEERGTTTLMVTHDAKIMEMADRIVTLEDGRGGGGHSRLIRPGFTQLYAGSMHRTCRRRMMSP